MLIAARRVTGYVFAAACLVLAGVGGGPPPPPPPKAAIVGRGHDGLGWHGWLACE
jgi:hypothetical protein